MRFIFLILALFSLSAFAQDENAKLIAKLTKIDLGNSVSACSPEKYDMSKFDFSEEYKKFSDQMKSENPDVLVYAKWNIVLGTISKFTPGEWMNTYKKLLDGGMVQAMFVSSPVQETCQHFCHSATFVTYFKNGRKVICYFTTEE